MKIINRWLSWLGIDLRLVPAPQHDLGNAYADDAAYAYWCGNDWHQRAARVMP